MRMPLDQTALLSFTSTRTSEVFMVFWANFFTCVSRARGWGQRCFLAARWMEHRATGRRKRPGAGRRVIADNAGARSPFLTCTSRWRRGAVALADAANAPRRA